MNQEEICQIEDVYYTTIQKMSALISQPYDGEDVKLNSDDIRERISNWTKGLKMSELQMFRLSYRLGSEITDAIKNLCDILRYELNKRTDFRGDLHQIGSYVDGIKVARVFDFDFLYIIEDKDVEVRADEEQGLYRVFRGGVEVKPRQLNSTLADCMDKIMSDISLPWPLEHGGYAGPEYSGIRFNGPAVSLQLFDKRGGENVRLIPLDITPVFPLPETIRESECVRGKIKNISQHNRMPLLLTGDVQKLYVVSHPLKNVWQPTTAYMESLIIRDLHPFSCVKVALQLTKAMLYFQQKERQPQDLRGTNSDDSTSVTVALERYAQITDGRERDIYRYQLNTKMRYQHMYLPLEARTRFREVSKSAISVNTAAIKHVILSHGAEIEGSYSTCWGDDEIDNEDKFNSTTLELIRAAYRELSNTESFNVSHAFLPLKISKFSLLPHALKEAARLTQTVQEECAAILDTFLKDDQVNLAVVLIIILELCNFLNTCTPRN